MHLGPVSFSACLAIAPIALFAQQQASLGVGAGVVRYAGGSSFSALTLAPAAQRFTTATYLGASGAVSWLEGGAAALQGEAIHRALLTGFLASIAQRDGETPEYTTGGGLKGGQVWGASDKSAALPVSNPVTPEDLIATLYHCLGVEA